MRPRASFAIFLICVSVIFTGFSTNIFFSPFPFSGSACIFICAAFFHFSRQPGNADPKFFSAAFVPQLGSCFPISPFTYIIPRAQKNETVLPDFFKVFLKKFRAGVFRESLIKSRGPEKTKLFSRIFIKVFYPAIREPVFSFFTYFNKANSKFSLISFLSFHEIFKKASVFLNKCE